jgi:hypothetical protein
MEISFRKVPFQKYKGPFSKNATPPTPPFTVKFFKKALQHLSRKVLVFGVGEKLRDFE